MIKLVVGLLLLLIIAPVQAVEVVSLQIAQLKKQDWHLQGIKISLRTPAQKTAHLQLAITALNLPKPFNDVKLVDVQCSQFNWGQQKISCTQGTARLQSQKFQSPQLQFFFLISAAHSEFQIKQLKLLQGQFDLTGTAEKENWHLTVNGKNMALTVLHDLLFPQLKLGSGTVDINAKAKGQGLIVKRLKAKLQTYNLSLQTADGTKAGEKLTFTTELMAAQLKNSWRWRSESFFNSGSLYVEPFYVENKATPISLTARGYWDTLTGIIDIDSLRFIHPHIAQVNGYATVQQRPKFSVSQGIVYAHIADLTQAGQVYLTPFIAATSLEGLSLAGEIEAKIALKNSAIQNGYFIANQLDINDAQQRFALSKGAITLNWADLKSFTTPSYVAWKDLTVYSLPMGRNYFPLLLKQKQIHLPKPLLFPFFEGEIHIEQFDWQAIANKSPQVHFSGQIHAVSLEKLTQALHLTPLSGYISGKIPSVDIADSKLSLNGGLKINLFDGDVEIRKLAISGFMTDFTQFYSDIAINNLDLEQLTQKFSFGGMQGRLSGYVTDLYLENWHPITFNAWLGTLDDDSVHQISQKAVNNIATIGGGGAVDAASRLILGLFDNFNYEKVGLGCYLYKSVCQLSGVEAVSTGYYIIKGGGLPRIDVMGYNTRIDWKVLQERLERITKTDKPVIE